MVEKDGLNNQKIAYSTDFCRSKYNGEGIEFCAVIS